MTTVAGAALRHARTVRHRVAHCSIDARKERGSGASAIECRHENPRIPSNNPESASPLAVRRDVALSGGALRLIEYEVAAVLSDIYRVQEIATGNVDRLANGVLTSATPFDPANRLASVRLLWLTLADIASAEAILLDLYRQHLPTIRAAANGDR
jgi:hypothetical protein